MHIGSVVISSSSVSSASVDSSDKSVTTFAANHAEESTTLSPTAYFSVVAVSSVFSGETCLITAFAPAVEPVTTAATAMPATTFCATVNAAILATRPVPAATADEAAPAPAAVAAAPAVATVPAAEVAATAEAAPAPAPAFAVTVARMVAAVLLPIKPFATVFSVLLHAQRTRLMGEKP